MSDELPPGWTSAPLSVSCSLVTDGTHHSPSNGPAGDFRYVSARHIKPWGLDLREVTFVDAATHREIFARCPVQRGDVLYIKDGATTGVAALNDLDEPFSLLSSVAVLRTKPELFDSGILKHWLNSPPAREKMLGDMTGTAIRRLVLKTIRETELPLPPLNEQRRIVAKLDVLLARSKKAREHLDRIPKLLDALRRSILAAAFRGDLTADWRAAHPDVEPASVLLERMRAERRRRWEHELRAKGKDPKKANYEEPTAVDESDLPELPPTWSWATAEALCERVVSGSTPSSDKMSEGAGEVPFIKVYNLRFDGVLDFSIKPTFVAKSTHEGLLARSRVFPGDVLMNIVGPPLGKVSVVPADHPEWNINQAITAFRLLPPLQPEFLSSFLQSAFSVDWARKNSKATSGQHNLGVSQCRVWPVPVPPIGEQQALLAAVKRCMARFDATEDLAAGWAKLLGSLDDGALAAAFRGELVPQDPNDEPARASLDRIRAAQSTPTAKRTRPPREVKAKAADATPADVAEALDLVVGVLVNGDKLSAERIRELTHLGNDDVKMVLKGLVAAGKVRVEGKARGTMYAWATDV